MCESLKKTGAAALAGLLAALLLAGCAAVRPDAVASADGEHADYFPAFASTDFDGEAVSESVFKGGRLTAVCFWSSECLYCPEQLKALSEAVGLHSDEGVGALGVLLDGENLTAARAAYDISGASFRQITAPASPDLSALMTQRRAPYTLFVNGEGVIVSEGYIGARDSGEWGEIITCLLQNE